tara:strand:- start:1575 stop:1787 length:213 start_codon:yes stop_codon:yes gene_type:complete
MKRIERLFTTFLLIIFSFLTGVYYTFYIIDNRLWDEEILKARDIETRYMNYPDKRCYKSDDLERIIYGKN